jgi:hypothetical protein
MTSRTISQYHSIDIFHDIFMSIVEKHRRAISSIAYQIGHTGRGKRRATISKYLAEMYEKKISMKPNLILRTHSEPQLKGYFCRVEERNRNRIGSIFEELKKNSALTYLLLLSGRYDFFLTSLNPSLNLREYGLISDTSTIFTPIYTIPSGWNLSFQDAAWRLLEADFTTGKLERKLEEVLAWSDIDMMIFQSMRENARKEFSTVAKEVGTAPNTVKNHYYKEILPCCNVAHYFFPKGYDNYMKSQFRIETEFEKSLIKSFSILPCTTYVYPLEDSLLVTFFHENINILLTLMAKMEEKGIVHSFEMYTPLWYCYV